MKPIQLYDTHDLDALIEVIHNDVVGVCEDHQCGHGFFRPDGDIETWGANCPQMHYEEEGTRGCGSALIRFGFDDESQPMPDLQQIDHEDYTVIVKRITLWDYLVDGMYNIEMLIEWEGDR